MRLFRIIALSVALGAFLSVPALTSAASTYDAYVACGYKTTAPPADSCAKSRHIGAFFQSKDATVMFKTCVHFPNGARKCTSKSTAQQGIIYLNKLTVGSKGLLTVHWKVDGITVARYTINVT